MNGGRRWHADHHDPVAVLLHEAHGRRRRIDGDGHPGGDRPGPVADLESVRDRVRDVLAEMRGGAGVDRPTAFAGDEDRVRRPAAECPGQLDIRAERDVLRRRCLEGFDHGAPQHAHLERPALERPLAIEPGHGQGVRDGLGGGEQHPILPGGHRLAVDGDGIVVALDAPHHPVLRALRNQAVPGLVLEREGEDFGRLDDRDDQDVAGLPGLVAGGQREGGRCVGGDFDAARPALEGGRGAHRPVDERYLGGRIAVDRVAQGHGVAPRDGRRAVRDKFEHAGNLVAVGTARGQAGEAE